MFSHLVIKYPQSFYGLMDKKHIKTMATEALVFIYISNSFFIHFLWFYMFVDGGYSSGLLGGENIQAVCYF